MDAQPVEIDGIFRALAEPSRRSILRLVRDEPMPVGKVAEAAGLSQQATSHHLRALHAAGLAERTQQGTRHLYGVRTDGLEAVREYLDDFWPTRLQALKHAVESSMGEHGA